jgi:hypothetical protein
MIRQGKLLPYICKYNTTTTNTHLSTVNQATSIIHMVRNTHVKVWENFFFLTTYPLSYSMLGQLNTHNQIQWNKVYKLQEKLE